MGSTLGGYLIGIGVVALVLSLGGLYAVQTYYSPIYNEVVSYKPMIRDFYDLAHSPIMDQIIASYKDFVVLLPELEKMAKEYSEAYPNITSAAELFYEATHSSEYNEVLKALRTHTEKLPSALESVGLGWMVPDQMFLFIRYLGDAQVWSDTARYAVGIIKTFPPEEAEIYLSQAKMLVSELPPDRIASYVSNARTASERAMYTVETLESYPPRMVAQLLIIGVVVGAVLTAGGGFLAYRSRNFRT